MKLDACLEKVQLPEGLVASSSGFLEEDVDDSSASPPCSSSNPFPVEKLSMVPYEAAKPERDVEATPEVAASNSDQELLQHAICTQSCEISKGKKMPKRQQARRKLSKRNQARRLWPKGSPKQTAAVTLQLQGDDIHGNDTMPEDVNVYTFESSVYGHCKCEIYSMKSYIRCKDISAGKWKSVLGSCTPNHGAICRKLVPHVTAGKSVQELYSIRASFMEELG